MKSTFTLLTPDTATTALLIVIGQDWVVHGRHRAVRGLAPTRPRAAGFAAWLFAGALGACGSALWYLGVSAAFVAVWYALVSGLTGPLGALLGPRVLRWRRSGARVATPTTRAFPRAGGLPGNRAGAHRAVLVQDGHPAGGAKADHCSDT